MDKQTPNPSEPDSELTPNQLLVIIYKRILAIAIAAAAVMAITLLFGCATPKAVEEHHHHHYEADTMAVKAQVDSHLQSWHQQIDSAWSERISQFVSQQQSSEHQQETVTETITETFDSLGRKLRQEQRTISRDISRELLSIEQSITRAYEQRLQFAVDSLESTWQQRYDSLTTHLTSSLDHQTSSTPVGDARPWYKKLSGALLYILIGVVLAAAFWLARRWPINNNQ